MTVRTTVPTETWVLPRPRKDAYPGGFPLHFEKKLWRLLGEPERVLHPFGGLAEIGDSVDVNASTAPTWVGDAHDLHFIADDWYDLVICDPPYSDEESEWIYATGPIRQSAWVAEAVRVCRPDGLVALYHVRMLPRPAGCELVHRVVVLTRVNHSARVCMVYRKMTDDRAAEFAAARDESAGQLVLGAS